MKLQPVYVLIALLLAVDNVFINFRIGGLSYDRLLEFLLFFAFFKTYLKTIKNNTFFKQWNRFIIAFGLLQLLVNFRLVILGHEEFEMVYTQFIKSFSFLVFSFLFLLIAEKDKKYIDIVLGGYLLICFFALLQHPLSPIASTMLNIKSFLYSSVEGGLQKLETESDYISGGYSSRFRLAGPFASTINYSYFALSSLIISGYMWLRFKGRFYTFIIIVIIITSVFTQTRSLLLAEILLIFGYFFFNPKYKSGKNKLIFVIGILFCGLIVYFGKDSFETGNSRIVNSNSENELRPYLWYTGIIAVFNHPIGITAKQYHEVQREMFAKFGKSGLLHLPSHNGLINIAIYYSIFGYILFFFLVKFILRYINSLKKEYIVYFNLALIAYLIHTSFHNGFILSKDYAFLLVIMLIGWEYNNNKIEQELNRNE